MGKVIAIILASILIGMIILLCLFSCIVASKSDEYWDEVKREKRNNERR